MNTEKIFNSIAFRYDLFNSVSSFGIDKIWRRRLALSLKQQKNISVLDVAVGTGDILLSIFENGCDVDYAAGIDVSEQMLEIAKRKLSGRKVDLKQAAAEQIPFEDNSFDLVTCAFGVRNFSQLETGIKEMLRVLKPNGKLLILEFSLPPNPLIRFFYLIYLKFYIPLLGKIITGNLDAYKYLSRTIQSFPSGEKFCKILRNAGFADTNAKYLTAGVVNLYTAIKPA
jgi:demethylmenaquinone methyltransferase/2-methoxy-6-polyprenyl-1,4-benzoquinol methylase